MGHETNSTDSIFSDAGFIDIKPRFQGDAFELELNKASKRLYILDNWICQDIMRFRDLFKRKLENGLDIKIALLYPDSPAAKRRSRDIKPNDPLYASKRINENIDWLIALNDANYSNFQLRLFRCLPTVELYVFDSLYVTANYFLGAESQNHPHLILDEKCQSKESIFIQCLKENFVTAFNSHNKEIIFGSKEDMLLW